MNHNTILLLIAELRGWFQTAHSLLWMDSDDPPAESLQDVEREIAQRTARLAALERGAGSGTWTATAAMSSHRRRLVDLKRWRQVRFTGFHGDPLPPDPSTAVRQPDAQDHSQRVAPDLPHLLD